MSVSGPLRRDEGANYHIRVFGLIDARWSAMLGNMKIATEHADDCGGRPCITTLSGRVADQAALLGVLNLAYDLGMVLLSVERQNAT